MPPNNWQSNIKLQASRLKRILFHVRHPIACVLAVLLVAGFLLINNLQRFEARGVLWRAGNLLGENVRARSARFTDTGTLRIQGLKVGDFARMDFVELHWSYPGLFMRRLDSLDVQGAHIWLRGLEATGRKRATKQKNAGGLGLFSITLRQLILRDGTLMLDNLGPGLPPVPVSVGAVDPLVFYNLHLGGTKSDALAMQLQTVDLENLVINSPYDPLTPVLKFKKITLKFSWDGIQQQHLDSLVFDSPEVYVGNDLFYFADELSEKTRKTAAKPNLPWTVSNFELLGGRLILVSFGRPGFMLPFIFQAKSKGLVLDDFSSLPFEQIGFEIPPSNLNYPKIGLRIHNMQGRLYVKLPPDNPNVHNLVPAITIDSAEWKGLKSGKLGVSMTFDRRGIFAEIKGAAEQGYFTGGFQIQLDGFSWLGWGSTTDMELGTITRLLSPENFVMQGKVNARFVTHGRSHDVEGLGGYVTLDTPGKMAITATDDLIKKIPTDWWATKRDLLEISLKAFRDYDYTSGRCDFTYAPPESFLKLSLDGLHGGRNFDIRWHDKRNKPGLGF